MRCTILLPAKRMTGPVHVHIPRTGMSSGAEEGCMPHLACNSSQGRPPGGSWCRAAAVRPSQTSPAHAA